MYHRILPLNCDRALQAHIIGLAIGDGNLSNPNGRAVRLRITCDTKYPRLIRKICLSLEKLLPKNRVAIIKERGNYLNISVYSNHLENLLGWKAGGGSKYHQNVKVPSWILRNKNYIAPCLRGLIETDGAVYKDRGYQMVAFTTIIPQLAEQVSMMFSKLGFHAHMYQVTGTVNPQFHVRLSRDTNRFLNIVRPLKA